MIEPDWSILVATVPSRIRTYFPDLLEVLQQQIGDRPIEVLGLYDNKYRTVGAKRNALLSMAEGRFLSFLDDDDCIAPNFVERIHDALLADPHADVFVYDQWCSVNGAQPYLCRYGIELEYTQTTTLWTGKPAHNMVWRTALVENLRFPELNIGEDTTWCQQASARAKTQIRIPETLYYYAAREDVSETRGAGLRRDVPAVYREWWESAVRRDPL